MPEEISQLLEQLKDLRQEFEDFRYKTNKQFSTIRKSGDLVSTNFRKIQIWGTVTLWVSNGTIPNGNLSGTAGDVCFGADSGKSYYNSGGGTVWTAF